MHTVGVQRQYTGTAGRIENAQVGVFLAYASCHGHTLIDRRVYLPKSWTEDRRRCEQAGVPDDVVFATRSELADDMITAAVQARVPARWVAADEAYGNNTRLRSELRTLRLGYVLAVSCDHLVPIDGGKTRRRADRLATDLPAAAWTRRSAGDGSKGPRFYDWAWLADVGADGDPDDDGRHSLLIRRNNTTSELAFYRCWTPRPATLAQLVRVAGVRWIVEESFQAAKGQVRARPAPGPPLDVLAPVHHPRPGRPRCPRDLRRRRPISRPSRSTRHDRADRQRNPPPDQHPAPPADPQHRLPFALVTLATTTPSPSQTSPLRPPPHPRTPTMITNGGCRIR